MRIIPQIEPWIDGTEMEELSEVVASTFITENRKTEQFLQGVRRLTGSSYAIATSNGTLAIVAALLAAGIGPGDEVIVPDLTFIASSNAVRLTGATPVFCDVDLETGCLSVAAASAAITSRTKAVMPVHLYGQMVDMDALMQMAFAHSLMVIEDAAEAFGITYRGRHAGTFGHFGTFSFFANKIVTCGEGGVVLCATAEDYARLYRIKNHGRDRKGIFIHESIGYNFCFTDLQAAIGVAQLRKFDRIMEGKRRVFQRYVSNLGNMDALTLVKPPSHVSSNYWFTNILVPDPDALGDYLTGHGIGSRRYFYPLHLQPCYSDLAAPSCPNSVSLYEHGLSLPSGPQLSDDEVDYVSDHVRSFLCV